MLLNIFLCFVIQKEQISMPMPTLNDQHFFLEEKRKEKKEMALNGNFMRTGLCWMITPKGTLFSPVLLLPEASFVIYYLLA